MKYPLKILREWFDTLPKNVRDGLAFDTALRLLEYNPLDDVQRTYRDWLDAPLDYFHHVGRVLSACAIIDYAMEEHGDNEGWE